MLQHDLLGEYVDKNGFNFTSELLARENLTCFVTGWLCIYIEDCEGWWLSGCHGSVAEHWWLKLEVSWVWLPVTAGLDWVNKANKCPIMEEVLARRVVTCWVSSHSIASLYWHLTLFWCVRNSSLILLAILVIKHRLKLNKSLLREMGYMWQKHNKVYLVST